MVVSCKEATNKKIETEVSKQADSLTAQVQQVAEFVGQQVVTESTAGRIFKLPRWRKGVDNSVVEITKDNQQIAFLIKNGILGNW
jgi:hypothetical protein